VGWNTGDGEHEGYVECLFADGYAGSGWSNGGITITADPEGRAVPFESLPSRSPADVVGWRVVCNGPSSAQIGHWRGEPWSAGDSNDPDARVLCVPADQRDDLTFDDELVGALLREEWKQQHLGSAFDELAEVRSAAAAVQAARSELDEAVAKARVAGASWESIGEATRMSRQSAHERWGRRV